MSSNFEPLIPATLAFDENGVPVSAQFSDVYHPHWGAFEQAERVFLKGNELPRRWQGTKQFTICETGFGLGHNFLAAWAAWRSDPRRSGRLHFISFEAHPFSSPDLRHLLLSRLSGIEKRLATELVAAWPPLLPGLHRLEFEEGRLTLTLALGSVKRLARQVEASVDAFFLDGFAPRVNPDMWTPALFGQLVRMANARATAATWCCAGEMRRALRDAGFLVNKVPGYGGKREMTVAVLRDGMGRVPTQPDEAQSIAVVGGGLAGAGVAHALALRGDKVSVFDPVFINGLGASHKGHLAAALSPVISSDDDIRARLSRAGVQRALQRWQALSYQAQPLRCGTLERVAGRQEVEEQQRALKRLRFPEEWVAWLDEGEASRRVGVKLTGGGLWFPEGQLVRPEPLLEGLLSQEGIRCLSQSVGKIRQAANGRWRILDASGAEVQCVDHVVLANASSAADLLEGVSAPERWKKVGGMLRIAGEVAYFPANGEADAKAIVAGDGYWLPAVHGLNVGGSTYVHSLAHAAVTPDGRRQIVEKLAGLLAGVPATWPEAPCDGLGWAGWRAALSDRLPVIGAIDDAPGLWLASGYGSRGLSWAALAGDVIAAAIHREPAPLERELLRKIAPR